MKWSWSFPAERAATKSEVSSSAEVTGSLRTAGGSVLARCARACWAVWAVVTIELLVALTLAARELTSVWEVQFGLLWLTPTALTLSAAAALLGAFVAWLVEQSET